MKDIFFTAPSHCIPKSNSKAYLLLKLLSGRKEWARDELCGLVGGDFRAYLQQLTGVMFGHWNIETVLKEYQGKRQAFYSLDERHFSGDWQQDKQARTIARKRYAERAERISRAGSRNLESKVKELKAALAEYDELIAKKKPTQDEPK